MDLLNFIGESNLNFSCLDDSSKKELLRLLRDYSISYRNRLTLNDNVTFGLEFEFKTENPNLIESKLKGLCYKWIFDKMKNNRPYEYLLNRQWDFKEENSIIVNDKLYGSEISTPILTDNIDAWKEVEDVCNLIKDNGGKIGESTAGHIHIGTQIIGNNPDAWLNFFRLYTLYEGLIYRFAFGEYESYRSKINTYAHPVANIYYEKLKKMDYSTGKHTIIKIMSEMIMPHKRSGISLYKVGQGGTSFKENRTIEFRMPNASLDPVIWQNNLNVFAHLLQRSNNELDVDLINSRLDSKIQNLGRAEKYIEINVEEALEFIDLVFDNNLDKLNFLRQYMKDFKITREFVKSKSFTKR